MPNRHAPEWRDLTLARWKTWTKALRRWVWNSPLGFGLEAPWKFKNQHLEMKVSPLRLELYVEAERDGFCPLNEMTPSRAAQATVQPSGGHNE